MHSLCAINLQNFKRLIFTSIFLFCFSSGSHSNPLYHQGTLDLPFNPAFVNRESLSDGYSLLVSSFHNAYIQDDGTFGYFAPDAIYRLPNVNQIDFDEFDPKSNIERLDKTNSSTVWPNKMIKAPKGFLPFEAIISPQGFHSALGNGRLVLINMEDTSRQEHIIHQSNPAKPAFYHDVVFWDVDKDGWEDIITVRSNFKLKPDFYPPHGEMVWFKNPGDAISPEQPWEETILNGGPMVNFKGPDIHLRLYDFEQDGIPEIVATHFFTGPTNEPNSASGSINLYGAPVGQTWADVNSATGNLPRVKVLNDNQGMPFGIEIVDLNRDGRADILATNHQPDNCSGMTSSAIPGRVYALEMPVSGDLFADDWSVRVLLDNIRPNPSLLGTNGNIQPPGRLAPGAAMAFYSFRYLELFSKPNILVGGDEAGKVWVLTPQNAHDSSNWQYHSRVILT